MIYTTTIQDSADTIAQLHIITEHLNVFLTCYSAEVLINQ